MNHIYFQLISLHDLKLGLESGATCIEEFKEKPAMIIQTFSTGYRGNGCALKSAPKELRAAQGLGLKRSPAGHGEDDSKIPVKKIRRHHNTKGEHKPQDADLLAPKEEAPGTSDTMKDMVVDASKMPPAKNTRKRRQREEPGSSKKRLALHRVAHPAAGKDNIAIVRYEPPPTVGRRSARIRNARQSRMT